MIVRRALPHLLALTLGVCAALLVACGGDGPEGGIPGANADELKKELADVQDFVDRGDCGSQLQGQLRQVREQLDNLPQSVDAQLEQTLRDAADRLDAAAFEECEAEEEPVETTEEPPETVTEQVPTITEEVPTTTTAPPVEPEPVPEEPAPEAPAPGDGGGQGGGDGSGGTPPELVP